MFFLVFQTLFFGFYMILCLLSVILGLILGHINIHYLSLFFMFATLVIPWWLAIGYKSLFYLRKTTKDLSIKINSDSILFSSDARDTKVNIKKIKIKEKENGILLIFKRVNNQKFSTCRNFLSKIIIWYDCIPLLKSNLKEKKRDRTNKGFDKTKVDFILIKFDSIASLFYVLQFLLVKGDFTKIEISFNLLYTTY